jgi:hypothetical protein
MEFSIFRLEIRGILFGIAVLCYIVYCIKKESFYLHFFFKKKSVVEQYKYNGRNDIKLLRGANLMLLITVIFILVYIMKIIFDIPYIINKEYFYIKGYTIEQSHGGADVSHERRSIFVKDEDTGKVFEITVFSEYIDENDFLEVEFLPHTKYGAIISREKSR